MSCSGPGLYASCPRPRHSTPSTLLPIHTHLAVLSIHAGVQGAWPSISCPGFQESSALSQENRPSDVLYIGSQKQPIQGGRGAFFEDEIAPTRPNSSYMSWYTAGGLFVVWCVN